MKLRELNIKDASFMLEWMKDKAVNYWFRFDAEKSGMKTVETFITKGNSKHEKHFAIVNDEDEYQGTVSLKNINLQDMNCEYAIVLRSCAKGKGYAYFATDKILNIAFEELDIHSVYLNVLTENKRAIRFYEKFGFQFRGVFKEHICHHGIFKDLAWYSIVKGEKNNEYKI